MRDRLDLFIISLLVLFLELACIRWFPAHVPFLTFFTNIVLLACFLGMSTGCLAARRPQNYLRWTPLVLIVALTAGHWVHLERQRTGSFLDVGNQLSPQLVFFGTEYGAGDPSVFVVPIEAVTTFLFILIALALVGPGQQLGRSLSRISNRVEAYTVNILGSLAGIAVFTACSWCELGPVWWFGLVVAGLLYFLWPAGLWRRVALAVASVAILLLAWGDLGALLRQGSNAVRVWSPYYRIDYYPEERFINVNLISHQQMISRGTFSPAYALPYLLHRDTGGAPFGQVLIIGAGSGNDLSRALEWGATRVDAVEIDPVIYRLGRRDHPDRPYDDPRVLVHLDDGRNFLRSTNAQYDLIIYALVDSLVLHSSYSNIRLESYLFTREAFADVKARLKPGGTFVMYNYFRQGWIVSRLTAMLEQTFGPGNPVVFNLPARDAVQPQDLLFNEFTVLFAGATAPLHEAFARRPEYRLRSDRPTDGSTPNGFEAPRDHSLVFRPATVVPPTPLLKGATDAWPFLYLRDPTIPTLNLRGAAIIAVVAAVFIAPFIRRRAKDTSPAANHRSNFGFTAQMFFLGAGFMLIETKAVVQMALLFGSTWIVNSIVFAAVLVMILAANLFVLRASPQSLTPYYIGLALSLIASAVVPLDAFLGLSREWQIVGSCLLAFLPILFAGVVFAVSFAGAEDADLAFGANIAGAMVGGLSEYSSMLIGFQYLVVVALAFYALSALGARRTSPLRATGVRVGSARQVLPPSDSFGSR
jgi:spermidine synthase